ncbi:efflux RND transporter periplasmic adaptor subunit [Massilia sp. W12]|uniref:efflux RND transporter periplasmic adaptor subunit n=1 Tax=Massilia sp. W12 TaxID=3126507 RepID=UPI0030D3E1C7
MSVHLEDKNEPQSGAPVDLLARLAHTERATGQTSQQVAPARLKSLALLITMIVVCAALILFVAVDWKSNTSPKAIGNESVSSRPPSAAAAPKPEVVSMDKGAELEASGYVVARNKSTVSSDITGRIKSINVVVGQTVKKGDVIAHLDDREALLRLAAAEIKVTQTRLAAENARVLMANEKDKLSQLKGLIEQKFVSESTYKQALAAYESATIKVKAEEANKADAENSLNAARIFAERHVIQAPFSGIVASVSAGAGETVSPTSGGGNSFIRSGIVQLVDPFSLYVVAEVPERQLQPIHVGQDVEIIGKAARSSVFVSKVSWVSPISNRQRGVVEVGINFNDPARQFIDGMEVNVRFMSKATGSKRE